VSIPDTPYVMVSEDAFDREALEGCFMKAEVVIVRNADMDRFSAAYDAAVAAVSARLERLAEARAAMRDRDIHAQYQTQIDDGQSGLNEAKAGLEDARSELDDGWEALADAERELLDGENQLSDADAQLKSGWQKLLAARAQLQETEAGLAEARAQLDAGAAELSERQAQLAAAKALLQASWEAMEDSKAEVRGAIRAAIEKLYGGDTSGIIDWAPRISMDPDKGGASAMDFWITTGFKCDLNKSMYENATDLIYSGEIPDEILIQAYEALTGGAP
jgi:putative ABC transport system permease protein